jgi:hypothetical protein
MTSGYEVVLVCSDNEGCSRVLQLHDEILTLVRQQHPELAADSRFEIRVAKCSEDLRRAFLDAGEQLKVAILFCKGLELPPDALASFLALFPDVSVVMAEAAQSPSPASHTEGEGLTLRILS